MKYEIRAISGDISISERTIEGMWAVYNSPSQVLMMQRANGDIIRFRETLMPGCFDRTDMTNVKCVLDHDEKGGYLGRTPGSLRIIPTERGMMYSCDLPNLPVGDRAMEFVQRGDYKGNSFRFYTRSGDDKWEIGEDGIYNRYITNVSGLAHVGPVFDPAYTDTEVQMAMRSLEESGVLEVEPTKVNYKEQRERSINVKLNKIKCLNY